MLPETSLLRRLPTLLDPEQRLLLEALVFSTDTLTFAHETILGIAIKYGATIGSISRHDRVALFSHCWTIVDHVHTVRQLLFSLLAGKFGPNQTRFCDRYETAALLRNKMDHLRANMPNLALAKGTRAPVFGAVSYFLVQPHQIKGTLNDQTIEAGTSVAITSGSVLTDKTLFAVATPGPKVRVPVGQFTLTAFGYAFPIDEAVTDLQSTFVQMAIELETDLLKQIEAISTTQNIPAEQLLASGRMGEVVLLANIEFRTDEGGTTPIAKEH